MLVFHYIIVMVYIYFYFINQFYPITTILYITQNENITEMTEPLYGKARSQENGWQERGWAFLVEDNFLVTFTRLWIFNESDMSGAECPSDSLSDSEIASFFKPSKYNTVYECV